MECQNLSTDVIVPALDAASYRDQLMSAALSSRPVVRLQRMKIDLYSANLIPPACIKDEPVDVLDAHIHIHPGHDVALLTDMSSVDMKPTDVEIEVPACSMDSADRLHRCNQHDSSRGRKSPLGLHSVGDCTGGKPYQSDLCDYSTEQLGDLKRHTKTHSEDKPHKCDQCEYQTAKRGALMRHVRTHTGEKPHKCVLCDYRTTQKSHIAIHMRTHTGERPYTCDLCDYRTAQKGRIARHMRTHTGERPYKCDQCDYQTAYRSVLVHHVKTHTGEKPYKCVLCDYRTARRSDLTTHMRTHSGDKPFKCDLCDHQTAWKKSLKRHMGTHTEKNHKCDQ